MFFFSAHYVSITGKGAVKKSKEAINTSLKGIITVGEISIHTLYTMGVYKFCIHN